MSSRDTDGHVLQLDGLRALAVAAVAWSHWLSEYSFGFQWGSMGVSLFFVLSGFLISGILLSCRDSSDGGAERAHSLRQFYVRRFLRIFPLFYATLFALAILNVRPVRASFPWHLFYLSNVYFFEHGAWLPEFGTISHFWSLAVEEQFYLVWPFVMLFLPRKWITYLLPALICLSPVYRICMAVAFPANHLAPILPFGCLDALGFGALLAWARAGDKTEKGRVSTVARVLLAIGVPLWLGAEVCRRLNWIPVLAPSLSLTAFDMICGWLVLGAVVGFKGAPGRFLSAPPLVYVGRISYGIYVLHNLAIYVLVFAVRTLHFPDWVLKNYWISRVLLAVLTLSAAAISWHFYEKPLNDLKRLFPYRTKRSRAPLQPAMAAPR